jgi:hypothetical protein
VAGQSLKKLLIKSESSPCTIIYSILADETLHFNRPLKRKEVLNGKQELARVRLNTGDELDFVMHPES